MKYERTRRILEERDRAFSIGCLCVTRMDWCQQVSSHALILSSQHRQNGADLSDVITREYSCMVSSKGILNTSLIINFVDKHTHQQKLMKGILRYFIVIILWMGYSGLNYF